MIEHTSRPTGTRSRYSRSKWMPDGRGADSSAPPHERSRATRAASFMPRACPRARRRSSRVGHRLPTAPRALPHSYSPAPTCRFSAARCNGGWASSARDPLGAEVASLEPAAATRWGAREERQTHPRKHRIPPAPCTWQKRFPRRPWLSIRHAMLPQLASRSHPPPAQARDKPQRPSGRWRACWKPG